MTGESLFVSTACTTMINVHLLIQYTNVFQLFHSQSPALKDIISTRDAVKVAILYHHFLRHNYLITGSRIPFNLKSEPRSVPGASELLPPTGSLVILAKCFGFA